MKIRNGKKNTFFLIFAFIFLIFFGSNPAFAVNPILAYHETTPDTSLVRYSLYSGSWSSGATAYDHSRTIKGQQAKIHPKNSSQVIVSADNNTPNPSLYASIYAGSSWSTTSLDSGTINTGDYRCFDAAYEQNSGKLLVVAASTVNRTIKYWTYDGSWSAVSSKLFSHPFNYIRYVRLASKPNANEIALVVQDDGAGGSPHAVALIWDGSNWGNEQALADATIDTADSENIAVEYMQTGTNGGKALFVWGDNPDIHGRVWNGSSWDGSDVTVNITSQNLRRMRLAADPNSDKMLLAFYHDVNTIKTVPWTGSAWSTADSIETTAWGYRPYDVVFESGSGHSGHALIVFSISDSGYFVSYKHSSDAGETWGSRTTILSGAGYARWIQLARQPDNLIHLAFHDSSENLEDYKWNNSSWTMQSQTISLDLEANVLTESFSLAGNSYGPTEVGLESFRGYRLNEGVLLEWQTGYEVNNLGFNIYREENGQRIRVNSEIIAGSAFLSGAGTTTSGYSYSWLDRSAISYQPSALKYCLEDVDINGKRTWHGPITPVFSERLLPKRSQSALLNHLGRNQAEQQPGFSRLQTLNARLPKISLEKSPTLSSKEFKSIEKLSPQEVQWALAGHPAVKLFIQEEGWYRVTQPELIAAGLNANVNPRFLQLFVEGEEQPILFTGKKDSQFGPKDAIEFYGKGLDTPFTDTRVYWLVAGSKPGKRVQQGFRSLGGRITSTSFPYTVEKKPRTVYFAALKNGEAENFFGPVVSQRPVDQVLSVLHLDPASPGEAILEVALQGVTVDTHQVKIFFNEAEVGKAIFDGRTRGVAKVSISQNGLRLGENVVTLAAQNGEADVSLVDSIKLTYWHTYTADDDVLRFTAAGGKHLLLDGFTSPRIQVMDITDPTKVQKVDGVVKAQAAGYSIRLEVPWPGQRTILAFSDERVEKPPAMEASHVSSWHGAKQGADLVIISHGDFLESLKPLKALREGQGLSVALIDVEDLYDEFSFGIKTPYALREFLMRAKSQWQKPPRFVLLVGDASFDPRNYLGLGNSDFVPTKLLDTFYLETSSDDWFADINGDGLPEMAVGRLPVRAVDEAQTVVSKIVGYEQSSGQMNEVLLVADIKDEDFDFEAANFQVKALLPENVNVLEIFRNRFEDDIQVRSKLLGILNGGPLLVNYVGHSTTEWWRGRVFSSGDADDLVNGLRLPFFVNMTCLNGFFHDLYTESLAESLLKAKNGGAVAVWASSGLTEPGGQAVMNKELVRLLFNGKSLTLGEAIRKAKGATGDGDVRRTWILFGDPTTKLKF